MVTLVNRAKMSTSTTGTGTITLGSAETGYQSFADAGVADGDVVRYVIEDGDDWEIGSGTYTATGTTLTRTVDESSNADAALNLTGSAVVFITAAAGDVFQGELFAENYDGTSTKPSATGTNAVAIGRWGIASGNNAISIGNYGRAAGASSISLGYHSSDHSTGEGAASLGYNADAAAPYSSAIGPYSVTAGSNNFPAAIGRSYASGTDSFAAAIANNTSSYGAKANNAIAMGQLAKADDHSVAVAIGYSTHSSGAGSVALGYDAHATGNYGVGIGKSARSSGAEAVAIGQNASAGGSNAVALGNGATASASNAYSFGGTASGTSAYSFGGTASGTSSVNLRGATASGDYSLAVGRQSVASIYGQKAFASGNFAANGDAQGSIFILRAATTDATATVLTTNNSTAASTNQIVAASDTCITFDGTITAMQNGAQAYASWKIEGLLVNDGGTTTLANSATTVIQNLSSWGMALSADNTNNALAITVTGEAAHNIRWVANIRTTEVTYA